MARVRDEEIKKRKGQEKDQAEVGPESPEVLEAADEPVR